MMPGLGRVVVLAACLAVGACAAAIELARPDPPRLYALTPKSTFADDLPLVDARISVEAPTATAGLNTAWIALRPTPTTLEYYAGARWIEVVPVMVQNLLLESLDNASRLDVLGREVVGIRADYALLTHIREFQAEYTGDGPPVVDVRIQARLVRLPRRTSIAATSAGFTVKAEDRSMQAIVAATDEGLGKALRGIVEWTVREVAKADAGPAPETRPAARSLAKESSHDGPDHPWDQFDLVVFGGTGDLALRASCCRASATAATTGSLPRIAAPLVCRAARSTGTAMCERSKAACAATSPPTTSTKPRSRSSLGGSDHVTLDATALEGWRGLAAKVARARFEEAA